MRRLTVHQGGITRQKGKTQLPIRVWNLGSPAGRHLDFAQKRLWGRMSSKIVQTAVGLPVFLVNEVQMDYLYPPERRRAIDPKRLREKLRSPFPHADHDPLKEVEDLDHSWERYCHIVAVGLYAQVGGYDATARQDVLNLGDAAHTDSEASATFSCINGAAIFLCPERIFNWAGEAEVSHDLVLAKIYYHELGHAYMDTLNGGSDPYNELWGRTVEESLANWIALRHFKDTEAAFVHRLIQQQPAEYRGCIAVEEHLFPAYTPDLPRPFMLEDWFDHLRWLDRRGILRHWMASPWAPFSPGRSNLLSWRFYKKAGAPPDPPIVRAWKQFARLLLEEAVARV